MRVKLRALFQHYLMNASYVPGSVPGTGDVAPDRNLQADFSDCRNVYSSVLCLMELVF